MTDRDQIPECPVCRINAHVEVRDGIALCSAQAHGFNGHAFRPPTDTRAEFTDMLAAAITETLPTLRPDIDLPSFTAGARVGAEAAIRYIRGGMPS